VGPRCLFPSASGSFVGSDFSVYANLFRPVKGAKSRPSLVGRPVFDVVASSAVFNVCPSSFGLQGWEITNSSAILGICIVSRSSFGFFLGVCHIYSLSPFPLSNVDLREEASLHFLLFFFFFFDLHLPVDAMVPYRNAGESLLSSFASASSSPFRVLISSLLTHARLLTRSHGWTPCSIVHPSLLLFLRPDPGS